MRASLVSSLGESIFSSVILAYSSSVFAVSYDDFDGSDLIDNTRWQPYNLEFVRDIKNEKLRVETRRFGSTNAITLNLVNPNTVDSIEADVNVTVASDSDAFARARIAGSFCDLDNTANGFLNDIFAEIGVGSKDSSLVVLVALYQCDDSDCATVQTVFEDDTTFGPPSFPLGEKTMSIAWDDTTDTFTFGYDGGTLAVDDSDVSVDLTACTSTNGDFKSIGTRVGRIGNANEGGHVQATFDNVKADGAAYDDFSSGRIDPNKWFRAEVVRAIESEGANNALRLKLLARNTERENLSIAFQNPDSIDSVRALVRIDEADFVDDNSSSTQVQFRISGVFHNDGSSTGPTDRTGDIWGQLLLYHSDSQSYMARCYTERANDSAGNTWTPLFDQDFGSWTLGKTHTVVFGYDGETGVWVCQVDDQRFEFSAPYQPSSVETAAVGNRQFHTRVRDVDGDGEEGIISVEIDDVEINAALFQVFEIFLDGFED